MEKTLIKQPEIGNSVDSEACAGCGDKHVATLVQRQRGLGDTIANVIDVTGLNFFADLYKKITGEDCNCKTRQEALNKLVPYGITEPE